MADELNNPLFEDEREFLERKKQEYERALRGDVEHIKEQGTQVGKVALVGAGLAGSVWLITKIFGGGKSKRKKNKSKGGRHAEASRHEDEDYSNRYDFDDDDDFELDDEAFSADRSAEFRSNDHESDDEGYDGHVNSFQDHGAHSARESARAFTAHEGQQPDFYDHDDDLDDFSRRAGVGSMDDEQRFDNGFGDSADDRDDLPPGRLDFGPAVYEHRQGYQSGVSLAYDDSRRLPRSNEFAEQASSSPESDEHESSRKFQTAPDDVDVAWPKTGQKSSLGKRVGGMVMSFLGTSTGKAVAAQATAAVLAYVTNKMNDKEPVRATAKNADLATAPATTSFYGSTAAPASSSPAVSLTFTDAPTEYPAS